MLMEHSQIFFFNYLFTTTLCVSLHVKNIAASRIS